MEICNITSKHKITPGTWEAVETRGSVCMGNTTVVTQPTGNWVAVTHVMGMPDYAEGNALLVAAAPELLAACQKEQEALEHYRTCDDCDQDDGHLCERASDLMEEAEALRIAAIAKATGASVA